MMDWQQPVSLGIVFAAAVLLFGSKLRRRKFDFRHATHCGCQPVHQTAPGSSIVFRARKGQRAEVIVKMRNGSARGQSSLFSARDPEKSAGLTPALKMR